MVSRVWCNNWFNSEIVIPIHKNDKVVAVLDIDSPMINRFDEEDKEGLLSLVQILENVTSISFFIL